MARTVIKGNASDTGTPVVNPAWYTSLGKNVPDFTSAYFGGWLTTPRMRLKSGRTGLQMTEVGSGTTATQVASALTGQDALEFNGKSIDTGVSAGADFSAMFIVDVTQAQIDANDIEWLLYGDFADPVFLGKRGGSQDWYINIANAENINGATLTAGKHVILFTARDDGAGNVLLNIYDNDFDTPYATGTKPRASISGTPNWLIGGSASGTVQWTEPLTAYILWDRDLSEDTDEWALAKPALEAAKTWATP